MYFDRLHVILASSTGQLLHDHLFQLAPPSSTTLTAGQFLIHYSAPSLDLRPRPKVTVKVTISQYSTGAVFADVEIRNDSGSAFRFSTQDVQLYVNGARVEQTNPAAEPLDVTDTVITQIYFKPSRFAAALSGLVYTSSDPLSDGFTKTDGTT
jgi:hypothetical protein